MSDQEVKIFSVSEINNSVKEVLERKFQEYIYVEGEISSKYCPKWPYVFDLERFNIYCPLHSLERQS